MSTGLSGTYGFNGTDLTLQPTTGHWVERTDYGVDGGAHPIYPAVRSFELSWELISPEDAKQIIDFYNVVGNTGTAVACLPQWGSIDYRFRNYSGSTLSEPTVGEYFQGYIMDMRLLILNIRT